MKRYVGDFETATWLKDETWVWAWAVAEIGNEDNIIIDNNIFVKKKIILLYISITLNLTGLLLFHTF